MKTNFYITLLIIFCCFKTSNASFFQLPPDTCSRNAWPATPFISDNECPSDYAAQHLALADELFARGKFQSALIHYFEALKISRLSQPLQAASIYLPIGRTLAETGDYNSSFIYLSKAHEHIQAAGTPHELFQVNSLLGKVYFKQQDYNTALEHLERSLQHSGEQPPGYMAETLCYHGLCLLKTGRPTRAIRSLRQSLDNIQGYEGDHPYLFKLHFILAEAYLMAGDLENALGYSMESLEIAQKQNDLYSLRDSYKKQADVLEKKGDPARAAELLKEYFILHDSIFNFEKNAQITEINNIYETEKIDLQLSSLNRESEHKNDLIKMHRILIWIIVAAIFIITFFVLTIFNQKEKQKLINVDLVKKNLEIVKNENQDTRQINELEKELQAETDKFRPYREGINQQISSLDLEYSTLRNEGLLKNSKEIFDSIQQKCRSIQSLLTSLSLPDNKMAGSQPVRVTGNHNNDDLLAAVLTVMERTKLYREEGFTLDKMAAHVGANKREVSRLINEEFGQGFNNFINNYRIKEARKILVDSHYQHYSIEGIANMVGFKSKSSFNFFFKKFTGLTPSTFKNSVLLANYLAEGQ